MKFEVISDSAMDELKKKLNEFQVKHKDAKFLGMNQNVVLIRERPLFIITICYE